MQNLILFDGICNICNNTVDFLIRIDKNKKLQFASLQSKFAKEKLREINFTVHVNSIIFIRNNNAFFYSDATAYILIEVGGFYKLLGKFILFFPKFIRDTIYRLIANHRYQWFGKRNNCRVPSDEEKERFRE